MDILSKIMHKTIPSLIACLAICLASSCWAQTFPIGPDDPIVVKALAYIAAHQNPDGGFGQMGESDLSTTSRVVEALAAAGKDPTSYVVNGMGPDDYMLLVSKSVYEGTLGTNPVADKINILLGLAACKLNPRDFGGRDHVQSLLSMQNESTGAFGSGPMDTAYAILALMASGVPADHPALQKARSYIEESQLPGGGFELFPGWGPDSNVICVVIVCLRQMGVRGETFQKAVSALPAFQSPSNRGFFWMDSPDPSSTALGIQAILAAGGDPRQPPWGEGGENPVKYLLSTFNATTGEFFDPWGSLRPTALAVPAILGRLTPGINISESAVLCSIPALLAVLLRFNGANRE